MPLVICSELGANLELMQPFVDGLDGFEVVVFDSPGVGQSSQHRAPRRQERGRQRQPHHPDLGIGELKSGGLHERQGARVAVRIQGGWRCAGDAPGQVEQVHRAQAAQRVLHDGVLLEDRAEPKCDAQIEHGAAPQNAGNMNQGAAIAVARPGSGEHDIVGAGRADRRQREQRDRDHGGGPDHRWHREAVVYRVLFFMLLYGFNLEI